MQLDYWEAVILTVALFTNCILRYKLQYNFKLVAAIPQEAIDKKTITEADIDMVLTRLFTYR